MVIFAMLGTLMFCSKLITEFLPNVHLLGMFTVVFTVVFRAKALVPIYVFVLLTGVYAGFAAWWVPYIYLWAVLWGMAMLIPHNLQPKWGYIVYPAVCGLHGFLYGTLYAPSQAIMFGLDVNQTIAWIITGMPWDLAHGISNIVVGTLAIPLIPLLKKLLQKAHI